MAKKRRSKSEKYSNVYLVTSGQKCNIGKFTASVFSRSGKFFETEEAAAKWVDLQLIRAGREPRNGFYKKVGTRGK